MEVQFSTSAAEQVARIIETERKGRYLRVFIEGGGCSGFQYRFELAEALEDDDSIFEAEEGEVGLVIDPLSLQYLDGATVDYIDDLMGSRFVVTNPNAASTCGCGSSFAV